MTATSLNCCDINNARFEKRNHVDEVLFFSFRSGASTKIKSSSTYRYFISGGVLYQVGQTVEMGDDLIDMMLLTIDEDRHAASRWFLLLLTTDFLHSNCSFLPKQLADMPQDAGLVFDPTDKMTFSCV